MSTEKTIATVKEAGLLALGAIGAAYVLDRDNGMMATTIVNTSGGPQSMVYQHWGGIVAVGMAWGSTQVTNPYIKAGMIGATIWGLLEEARNDFGWSATNPMVIYKGGNWPMMGTQNAQQQAALDAAMKEAAAKRLSGGNAAIANKGGAAIGGLIRRNKAPGSYMGNSITMERNSGVGARQRRS